MKKVYSTGIPCEVGELDLIYCLQYNFIKVNMQSNWWIDGYSNANDANIVHGYMC